MIDIVIPTMWHSDGFIDSLEKYAACPKINKIIVVDNNKKKRPASEILNHEKIQLISYGRNIYVNPAWNEGYRNCTSDIFGIVNDDISIADEVFEMVSDFKWKVGDLIGVNLRGYQDNYKIDDHINTKEKIVKLNYDDSSPIGGQAWAFGICMFMLKKTYKMIPSLYQIWYGDDFLAQNSKAVYAINSNKIKGRISETLQKFKDPDNDVNKRIELDSKNLLKFHHFKNAGNWDIPKNMISKFKNDRTRSNIFQKEYENAKNTPSDINENVHILYDLAKECKTVVEMGVRTGVSTRAFLNADVELLAFDLFIDSRVYDLFDKAKKAGKKVQYIKEDVLNIEIEETDLLFIDTYHTYDQLRKELQLHGNKAKKYIAFHDTHTFGLKGEDGKDQKGLMTAIIEFMIENPHWKFKINRTNNNGLMVIERT